MKRKKQINVKPTDHRLRFTVNINQRISLILNHLMQKNQLGRKTSAKRFKLKQPFYGIETARRRQTNTPKTQNFKNQQQLHCIKLIKIHSNSL